VTAPQIPAWLADRNTATDKVRVQKCRRCSAPVLQAWVGRTAALDIRADPRPIGLAEELAIRTAGGFTYCLSIRPHLPPRLLDRHQWHIAAGRCTHTVVTDHHCPGRPAAPIQEALL
jgi:hypothetical protein